MFDALLVLQASVTKTSSFNSTGVNLPAGTPSRGLVARVGYSAATNASGSNSVVFSLEKSADDSTYYEFVDGESDIVTLSTTAQAKEIFLPFRLDAAFPYVRLVQTTAGAGSTPTITYFADIGLAKP